MAAPPAPHDPPAGQPPAVPARPVPDRPEPVEAEVPPAPPEPDRLTLADGFPAADRDAWRDLARAVLVKAGAAHDVDPEQALARTSLDGIAVAPLYLRDDDPDVPAVTRAPGSWDVRVRHDDPDPVAANDAVLADLEGGATSLWLRVGAGAIAVDDLPRVLDGVLLDLVEIVLDPTPDAAVAAAQALLDRAGPDRSTAISGCVGFDPVGSAFRRGADRPEPAHGPLAAMRFPGVRTATVDGTAYHDAGASDVDEIAFATATAVHYLREFDADGTEDTGTAAAFDRIEFRFAVTDRQFPSIAKLRAARRIWARVAELSGAPDAVQRQHAVTSAAMVTARDPWVNMLRATVAGFAAAAGGADAITVLPYDVALGRPDVTARRIARNVQAILHDEASLARVLDPAAGSWYVESLTDELAHRAWERFTAIERDGGIVAALSNGSLRAAVERSRAERAGRIAHRTDPLTGTSEFPDLDERTVERRGATTVPGLHRWAEPFEQLRERSDRVLRETGGRPTVTLLALGPRGASAGRVGFATNLFQAGGIAVDVVTDGAQCTGPVACLCSSDKVYAAEGAAAVSAARAAGVAQLWLAGTVELDGVDGRLFAGGDALDVLTRTWAALGPDGRDDRGTADRHPSGHSEEVPA